MSKIRLKLVRNNSSAYVQSPAAQPTIITSQISDLSLYSTTDNMLANDATTYANSINYTDSRGFVNSSQLAANLANYTPTANLTLSSLSDVDITLAANNATLVYNSANNKYVVKQLDVDGGSF